MTDEEKVRRAAELLGVPVDGRFYINLLADVLLKLAEKEAARG